MKILSRCMCLFMVIPTLIALMHEKEPPQTSTFSFFLPWLDQSIFEAEALRKDPLKTLLSSVPVPQLAPFTDVDGSRRTIVEGRRDYE